MNTCCMIVYNQKQNFTEIVNVFWASVNQDERHRYEDRQWLDVKYRIHFFEFEAADRKKFTIWGLTAAILIRAASIILQRPADFPEFNPNFEALAKQAMEGKDHKM